MPRFVMKAYENQCHKETHINRALRRSGPDTTYVEIGVRDGTCIRQIEAVRKAAIDPSPVNPDFIESDGTTLFQTTSDEFFEKWAAAWLEGRKIDVALVDGLHEFKQALRDVLHLEPLMARNGVIFVHDCNPPRRRHEQDMNGPWNGDVWKVAYFLCHFRPDLKFFTLDCDWGLGVLSGFNPNSGRPDEDQLTRIKNLDYQILESNREGILNLRNPLYSMYHFSKFAYALRLRK